MTQNTDTYEETEIESNAIPYPCSDLPLDRFVNFIRIDENPCCYTHSPNFLERIQEQWIVNRVTKQLEQERKDAIKATARSMKTYLSNFNNNRIPSIWQTNQWGDQIRSQHVPGVKRQDYLKI